MKIDDVVLIKDENTPRNDWPIGIIGNVEPDSKGLVGSAVMRTKTTELWRSVHRLALLLAVEDPMDAEDSSDDSDKPLV